MYTCVSQVHSFAKFPMQRGRKGRALVGEVQLGGAQQEGGPSALQKVTAPDLDGRAVQLQQAAQEGLFVEVVAAHKHQRRPVRQALRDRPIADLAQQHIRRRDLQPARLSCLITCTCELVYVGC